MISSLGNKDWMSKAPQSRPNASTESRSSKAESASPFALISEGTKPNVASSSSSPSSISSTSPTSERAEDFATRLKNTETRRSEMFEVNKSDSPAPNKSVGPAKVATPEKRESIGVKEKSAENKDLEASESASSKKKEQRPETVDAMMSAFFMKAGASGAPISKSIEAEGFVSTQQEKANPAVRNFLNSMQNEVGVDRDELVEAMKGLSQKDLLQSPAENKEKVLGQLDLSSEKQLKAEKIYDGLVGDLKEQKTEMFLPQRLMQGSPAENSRLEANKNLSEALDRLNQKFFMSQANLKGSEQQPESDEASEVVNPAQKMGPEMFFATRGMRPTDSVVSSDFTGRAALRPMEATAAESSGNLKLENWDPQNVESRNFDARSLDTKNREAVASPYSNPEAQLRGAEGTVPVMSTESFLSTLNGLNGNVEKISADSLSSADEYTEDNLALKDSLGSKQALQGSFQNESQLQSSEDDSSDEKGAALFQGERGLKSNFLNQDANFKEANGANFTKAMAKKENIKVNSELSNLSSQAVDSSGRMSQFVQDSSQQGANVAGGGLAAGSEVSKLNPNANSAAAEKIQNLQEIVNQSQSMAKKGGGEMTVKLKPEGVGEVELKVSVRDGKVNVDMMTESADAKKMLEHSLKDLKTGLESHNLHVETLKVDVADRTSNPDMNSNNSENREAARQFLSDFREQNQSFRQGWFDPRPMKSYGAASRRAQEVQPQSYAPQSRRPRTDGGRLDLVA